ncbi:MAG: hypothetical protein CL785_03860 [Chloroflexi bacterium]|nr:hypothetical protein [Chloroflexota bacterium]|tara:strand:+ start:58214 stop:58951 length:738 start_codon:yes stop_codon:yes gene_type:complete
MIYDSNFEIVGPNYKLGASKHFSTDNDSSIIFSHGLEGDKDGSKWMEWSNFLPTKGFNVLRFNYRGCGKSTEQPSDGDFFDTTLSSRVFDYELVLNSLSDFGLDNFQLGAIGSSFGGMVIAASANPKLKAIALVATPFSLDFDLGEDVPSGTLELESGEFLSGEFLKDIVLYDIGEKLQQYNIPTIIIHGSKDEVVPVAHAYKLYDSINAPRELHIIEGADHSLTNSSHRDEAIQLITQWMLKYL